MCETELVETTCGSCVCTCGSKAEECKVKSFQLRVKYVGIRTHLRVSAAERHGTVTLATILTRYRRPPHMIDDMVSLRNNFSDLHHISD